MLMTLAQAALALINSACSYNPSNKIQNTAFCSTSCFEDFQIVYG